MIMCEHDTGDVCLWADDFEEYIYYQIVEEVAEGDEELNSGYIKAHIEWLNDEHKRLLKETAINDLFEQLPEPQEFLIWV